MKSMPRKANAFRWLVTIPGSDSLLRASWSEATTSIPQFLNMGN